MDTIKHLLSNARRRDGHAAWRKTYADEIEQIRSRATAGASAGTDTA